VQDAAAALPVRVLDPKPGERILDMCAAPGGKTLQLAAGGAEVTALDLSGPRLARLRENLARTKLWAEVVQGDATRWRGPAPFDAVLLDAPCSATGTIRRHPDLPFVKDGFEIHGLIELQARMIDSALRLLRPGGRLVFCTCSLIPDEGEAQLDAALSRHPGLVVEPPQDVPGLEPGWLTPEGALRLRPDHWASRGGIDGFFIVRLRKPEDR
jgi:16S rRNA (cytosine967-C5)-methyltransferase